MFKKKTPLINNPLNLNNSRQTRFILIGLFLILVGIIAIIDYRGMIGNFLVFPTLYLFGIFHFLWAVALIAYGAYLAIFRQNLKIKITLNLVALIVMLIIFMIGFSDYKTTLTDFFSFFNNSFFSNRLLVVTDLLTSSIGGGLVGFILYSTMVTLVGVDVTQIIYLLTFIAMVFIILRPLVYRLGAKMITYRQEREQKVKIRQEARKRGFNKFYGDSKNNVFLDEREALESLAVNISNEPEVTTLDDDNFIRREPNQPTGATSTAVGNFNIFKDNFASDRGQSVASTSTTKPSSSGGSFNIFKDPVIEGSSPVPTSPAPTMTGTGSSYFQTAPTRGTQGGIFASEPTPIPITPPIEPQVEELETSAFVDEINKPESMDQDLPFANDQEINEYFEKEKPIVKVRRGKYIFPSLELLESSEIDDLTKKREDAGINAVKINTKLEILGIRGKVKDFIIAPAFTRFLVEVESDVKMSVFNTITNDIMAAVSSSKINILAPIPNSPYVGIDIPNSKRSKVTLKELFVNIPFGQQSSLLTVPLGKDINGATVSVEINKTPHMLIAGTTGSGKSVCMNSIIMSLLLKTSPDDVRMMIVDPKRVEMSAFNDLPHLLCPIITDAKKAAVALNKLVGVMESRYQMFQETGNKNIESFNRYAVDNNKEKIPYYIVIIDELADLILVSSKEVEEAIRRITQLARAAGIHLIVATQRPSVDVITGVIKANIPTRIAFAVSSYVDSKTILDAVGAEDLLGLGDMLLSLSGSGGIQRVQGSYVSDDEIYKVVSHVKKQREPNFDPEFLNLEPPVPEQMSFSDEFADDTQEDLYFQILNFLSTQKVVSISSLQRKFNLGFPRAGSFIDRLESEGLVSVNKGSKPRDVYQDLIQTRLNQG
jgi:DNA segregation ATPase FtsK/SpoIIIE, S-DNA-T family